MLRNRWWPRTNESTDLGLQRVDKMKVSGPQHNASRSLTLDNFRLGNVVPSATRLRLVMTTVTKSRTAGPWDCWVSAGPAPLTSVFLSLPLTPCQCLQHSRRHLLSCQRIPHVNDDWAHSGDIPPDIPSVIFLLSSFFLCWHLRPNGADLLQAVDGFSSAGNRSKKRAYRVTTSGAFSSGIGMGSTDSDSEDNASLLEVVYLYH